MPEKIKVWSWRQAIAKAKLESSTKLVLFILANYMNEHGGGCYPTVETITEESGLSDRTVRTHLHKARDAGFIEVRKHGFSGQEWANNEYHARYPEHMVTQDIDENQSKKGAATIAAASLQQQENGAATITAALDEGAATIAEKVRQPLPTNSPVISPEAASACVPAREAQTPPAIDAAAAAEIVKAFDIILAQEFGITAVRSEAQRKAKQADDMAQAAAFMAAGADLNFCKQVFRRKLAQRKAMGGRPAGGLVYFSAIIPEELLMARASGTISKPAAPVTAQQLTIADIGEDTQDNQGFLKILNTMRRVHGEAVFKSWFVQLRLKHKNCSAITITAPSRLHVDWVRQRYETDLKQLAAKLWPEITSIIITNR